jgi:hypothetical protein
MATKESTETAITQADAGNISLMGEQLRTIIERVPETSADDAQYRIVQQILNSESVEELDNPWNAASGLGTFDGQTITVRSIRRAPSSFKGGAGIFLILDVEDEAGDEHIATTGSVSVVVQLLKAFELQAYPLKVIPRVSERESRNGYYPQHLEIPRNG